MKPLIIIMQNTLLIKKLPKRFLLRPKPHILPIIILAQFAGTSVWFAGNAIVEELMVATGIGMALVGYVLSAVQLGFIIGTLTFAFLMLADRYSPSKVFMVSALLAALCNLGMLIENISPAVLLLSRFGTGFFLAGIYPVGMKISADYYDKGLGKALGLLVGALVLGKAFPYLVKSLEWGDKYATVIMVTSLLAAAGGLILWLTVPDGPYRKSSKKLNFKKGITVFKLADFRKAAFGYFGHMWELYAFWAFIPLAITTFNTIHNTDISSKWSTFIVIALGSVACAYGGLLSLRVGSLKVGYYALLISGICCLLSPFVFHLPVVLFMGVFMVWGMAVIADSGQFSTLVASAAPPEIKGTALTLVNSLGFAISILSIQLLSFLIDKINPTFLFLPLAIGPLFGLYNLIKKRS